MKHIMNEKCSANYQSENKLSAVHSKWEHNLKIKYIKQS